VGWLQNLKTVKGWAEAAYESGPRWARIVRVGPRVGPFTRILLEVHYSDQPPFEASALSWVPRGVKPEVGQDVTVRRSTGDNHDAWEILWDQPPHYGAAGQPQG
jgi:hypothetical protein